MKRKMSSADFVGKILSNILDAAKDHFDRARGAISSVEVQCASDGRIYVVDETGARSRVTYAGVERGADAPRVVFDLVVNLSGFCSREQWMNQLRESIRRWPILTAENGWEE